MAPNNHPGFSSGRTVKASQLQYIYRKTDDELFHLCQNHAPAHILHAPQMGKSSLLAKTAERLATESHLSVLIDLSQFPLPPREEEWFQKIVLLLEDDLDLSSEALPWWTAHDSLSPAERMIEFFREVVLPETPHPITLFLDEIERTLSLDFRLSIFHWLHTLYELRDTEPDFARVSFVICGVSTPEQLLPHAVPPLFQYSTEVVLTDFSLQETLPLSAGLSLPSELAQEVLEWVYQWTQGHPYLTQLCCQVLEEQHRSTWTAPEVDECLRYFLSSPQGQQSRNLQLVRSALVEADASGRSLLPPLLSLLEGRSHTSQFDQESLDRLKLSGVIREHEGNLVIRNQVYTELFTPSWVKRHLPPPDRPRPLPYFVAASLALLGLGIVFWQFQETTPHVPIATSSKQEAIPPSPAPHILKDGGLPARHTEKKIQELEATIGRYQQLGNEEVEALRAQRASLENQLSTTSGRLEASQQQIADLQASLTEEEQLLEQERQAFERTNAQLRLKNDETTEQLRLTKVELEKLQQVLLERSSLTSTEAKKLLSDRSQLETSLLTANQKLQESQERARSLESLLSTQQQQAATEAMQANQAHIQLTAKLEGLQKELDQSRALLLTTEQHALEHRQLTQQELRRLRREREELSEQLTQHQNTVDTLKVSLANQSETLREANQANNSLTTNFHILKDQQTQAEAHIDQLEAKLSENQRALKEADRTKNSLTTRLGILESRKAEAESHIAQLEKSASEAQRASQKADQTHASLMAELQDLEDRETAAREHVSTLEQQLSQERQTSQQALENLKKDNQRLTVRLNGLTADLQAATDQTTSLTALLQEKESEVVEQQTKIRDIHASSTEEGHRREQRIKELTDSRNQLEKALKEKDIALIEAQERITKLGQKARQTQVATIPPKTTPISPSVGTNHSQSSLSQMVKLLPSMIAPGSQPVPKGANEPSRLLLARQAFLFSLHHGGIALASIDRSLRTVLRSSPVRLKGTPGRINDLAFDSTGELLVGGSSTGKLLTWNIQEPFRPPRSFSGHSASILNVQVSPGNQLIATGSQDSTIRLWNTSRMTSAPQILQGHIKGVSALAFSPDGQHLASGSQDHTIRIWDLSSTPPSNRIAGTHAGWVNTLVYSPDGRHLISAGDDLTIQIWDLQRRDAPPRVFHGHTQPISHLAIHPSGSVLASASRGTQIGLWNLRGTTDAPTFLKGHSKRVSHLAFSPDGHTLISVGLDKTARIWNWEQPSEPAVVLPPQKGSLRTIAITPDGFTLAVGGTGSYVALWPSTVKLADAVCDSVQRNLTLQEWRERVGPTVPYERTCPNLPLHPSFLKEGENLARQGKQEQAKAIFQRAKKLDPFLKFDPQREVERLSAKSS